MVRRTDVVVTQSKNTRHCIFSIDFGLQRNFSYLMPFISRTHVGYSKAFYEYFIHYYLSIHLEMYMFKNVLNRKKPEF